MRCSIITTVYNREPHVLANTFRALAKNNLQDTEVIIVNDASDWIYHPGEMLQEEFPTLPARIIDIDTAKDRPGTYSIDGYNNPAYAWNVGLEAARGEILMMLASDCMLQPECVQKARGCKNRVWMCSVIDLDSYPLYFLGPKRMAPYGWFMAWRREDAGEIRQDEEYLKGIAFDDNDFTARLALAVKTVVVDLSMAAFHQSHPQLAYSDGLRGHDINERYTFRKWGGIPWTNLHNDPLQLSFHQSGAEVRITVTRKSEQAQRLPAGVDFV